MDPYEFEGLVAEIWELQGYQTTVRKGSGDRGIDVEATRESPFSEKILIQAKRYSGKNKIGSREVRNYATLYQQVPDADTVVIVTTGEVTSEGQKLARDLDVKIVDGESFSGLVASHQNDLSIKLKTTRSPPNKSSDFTNTKTKTPRPFNKCPICDGTNMSIGDKMDLSCNRCGSGWVRDKKGGNSQIWRGVAGTAKGKYGSKDEWRHHSDYILNSTERDVEENQQFGQEIRSKSNDAELGKVGGTLIAAIAAVPMTIITLLVVGFPLFIIFPNLDMTYIMLLSYLAALLIVLKVN
mgnify:CR=1 FL=1